MTDSPAQHTEPPQRGDPHAAGEVTRTLAAADAPAEGLDAILPIVYEELRLLARRALSSEASDFTLNPTDLVHETFVRLRSERTGWTDRQGFMIAAAVAMRRALVDHARRRNAAKRGGGRHRVDGLDRLAIEDRHFDVLVIEDAMLRLESEDADAAAVAELRVYGGASVESCATALGVSAKTIQRRWRFARACLLADLDEAQAS